MAKTEVVFGAEARKGLLAGVLTLGNAVASTLGPRGRNVLIAPGVKRNVITKDGVSVAKAIELSNPLQAAGARLLRNVASEACSNADDGTTTATVLAMTLIAKGFEALDKDLCPVRMKAGVDDAVDQVAQLLTVWSTPVNTKEELISVATISANGDHRIGEHIGSCVYDVGVNGAITIREGTNYQTTVERAQGMMLPAGLIHEALLPEASRQLILDGTTVIIVNGELGAERMLELIKHVTDLGVDSILLLAETYSEDAEDMAINIRRKRAANLAVIKTPGFGGRQQAYIVDICKYLGTQLTSNKFGETIHLAMNVGVTTTRQHTILSSESTHAKADVDMHVEALQATLNTTEQGHHANVLRDRISSLTSGHVTISVGGTSEVDIKERKDRYDDALGAARAAKEGGVLPGGGIALHNAADHITAGSPRGSQRSIESYVAGIELVRHACRAPLAMICRNAGENYEEILTALASDQRPTFGWDANLGQAVDMMEAGIIDPAKVTIGSFTHAISAASLLLTTDSVILDEVSLGRE